MIAGTVAAGLLLAGAVAFVAYTLRMVSIETRKTFGRVVDRLDALEERIEELERERS